MREAKLISGVVPGSTVDFTYNGTPVTGHQEEGIAAALMRAGVQGTRVTDKLEQARGYFCGMGVCWECVVEVAGEGFVKGCQYPVRAGLVVRSASTTEDTRCSR